MLQTVLNRMPSWSFSVLAMTGIYNIVCGAFSWVVPFRLKYVKWLYPNRKASLDRESFLTVWKQLKAGAA